MHFGTTSTSRVEGNHHTIKSYLQLEKLDLLQVIKKLHLMLSNQKAEITKGIENEKIIFSHSHRIDCFKNLIFKVSQYALEKILHQYELSQEVTKRICSKQFMSTYGLPCSHRISEFLEAGLSIPLDSIHEQWRLDLDYAVQATIEPVSPRREVLMQMENRLHANDAILGSLIPRMKNVIDSPFTNHY